MSEEYIVFRSFPDMEQVSELAEILNKSGIPTRIGDNAPAVDITFTGGAAINTRIEIRIPQKDYKKAEQVLEDLAKENLNNVDPDYYLFSFTNEELFEILQKSDEWSNFDYNLAQKILKDRGEPIDAEYIEKLKNERMKKLAEPDNRASLTITLGYLLAFMGGFLGLLIGYFLWTSKKSLPDGSRVYSYSKEDRKDGKYIFFIGAAFGLGAIIYKMNLYSF